MPRCDNPTQTSRKRAPTTIELDWCAGPALAVSTSDAHIAKGLAHSAKKGQSVSDSLEVWIDQDECTGDGLCVQYAPEVFEFDIDGLAYVKTATGELLQTVGARVDVPESLRLDVLDSAEKCPGNCIHVARATG